MSRAGVEQLLNKVITDPDFRQQLRADPAAAIANNNIDLSGDELAALQTAEIPESDDEMVDAAQGAAHAMFQAAP